MAYGLARASQGNSTTVMGVGRPTVEPPQLPNVITRQPVSPVQMPTPGAVAVAPAPAAAPDEAREKACKALPRLMLYNGENHLETFLAKFRYISQYLG